MSSCGRSTVPTCSPTRRKLRARSRKRTVRARSARSASRTSPLRKRPRSPNSSSSRWSAIRANSSPLHLAPLFDGIFDQSMAEGMGFLAWSPLGGGRLGDPADERSQAVAGLLDAKAAEYGVSRAAATYSWVMAHPARPIPIVGTQNVERIRKSRRPSPRAGRAPNGMRCCRHRWGRNCHDRPDVRSQLVFSALRRRL